MKKRIMVILLVGVACLQTAVPAQDDFSKGFLLDVNLKDVSSRDVMWSLARVLGAELSFDPLLDQQVTIELHQAGVLEALDRVCEATHRADPEGRDCSWQIRKGDPPVLSVGWKQLSLDLVGADLGSVLHVFGSVIDAESVEVDPALRASTTVKLEQVHWFEALDAVCEQAGCRWRVERGPGSRLRLVVEGTGPDAGGDVSVRLAGGSDRKAEWTATEVGFALQPLGPVAPLASGIAVFVGTERTFRIAAADGVPWEAVLSRVSVGPGRAVLVPFLLDCTVPRSVTAFDPVGLPVDRVWMSVTRKARLDLRPAGAESPARAIPTACVQWSNARVGVRVADSSASQAPTRGAMLVLVADEPGRVLQLSMPPTADRPRTTEEAGIVVLDRHPDGRLELGIVGSDRAGEPFMQRGSLAPGEVWDVSESLGAPATFRIELALLAPGSDSWPG